MDTSLRQYNQTPLKVPFWESVFWRARQRLLFLVSIFLLLLVLPQTVRAQTIPYSLTDDATGGDCIVFGEWDEGTKTCTMTADISAPIVISSDGITLDGNGHSVTGTGTGTGISITSRTGVIVKHLSVFDFWYGIIIDTSSSVVISKVTFTDQINMLRGVSFLNTHHSRLEDSLLVGSGLWHGINITQSNDNVIDQVSITGGTPAVMINTAHRNIFTHCTFNTHAIGAQLISSNDNMFTGNQFIGTGVGSSIGMQLSSSSGNIYTENTVENVMYNMYVSGAPQYQTPNQWYHNNFINYINRGIVAYGSGVNLFSAPLPIGGNYWEKYDEPSEGCFDMDGDRMCEGAYGIGAEAIDWDPWVARNAWQTQRDPVILIPGITGSWNWDVLLHDESGGTWQFPPFSNVYQPLVEKLKEKGYEEGKTLFIAFYDWRQPNVISAQQYLKPIIDQAKLVSGKDKVDLIGHSMGGILARAYIQGSHYENDVDQLITLGTPHYGSGDAYTVWEGGYVPDNWDTVYRSILKGYLLWKFKAYDQQTRYPAIHTFISSLHDLLPTYDYLKDKTTDSLKLTNTLHEQNTFLNVFNPVANELNSLVRSVTTVAGDDQYTVDEIPFVERLPQEEPLWVDGKPEPLDPEHNDVKGDNTVLLTSAHLQEVIDQVTIPETTHRDLVSKAAPAIFTRLGLPDPGALELVAEPESILSFWFASPVLPTVTDPLGNSISKDVSTIPDAVYFGEDDPNGKKMILIPNPTQGRYHVDLVGTGEGHYDFASAFFKQNVPDAMQIFSGEVHQGAEITYDADVNPEDPEHPISTEIVDTEPPILNIPSPQHESEHLDTEILPLTLTGTDPLSGLTELTLFLDNTLISSTTTTSTSTYLLDLSLTPLGSHTVKGIGKDNAGNTAVIEALFNNTTSYDAILQNLDHYESLGLLHPLAKRILAPQVKAAQKLAQQYAKRQDPRLKLALNKLLDTLIIEVQKFEAKGLIHHTASPHLQEEFLVLKQ